MEELLAIDSLLQTHTNRIVCFCKYKKHKRNNMLDAKVPEAGRKYFLEDFPVGEIFRTPSVRISDEQVVEFARVYDPQYYHLDPEAAKNSVFGGLVAGGFQTAALSWALGLKTGLFDHCAMAGIGVDGLRWLKPLRAGDTVQCTLECIANTPSATRNDRGVVTFHYVMTNQDNETIMTLNLIQMLRSRQK